MIIFIDNFLGGKQHHGFSKKGGGEILAEKKCHLLPDRDHGGGGHWTTTWQMKMESIVVMRKGGGWGNQLVRILSCLEWSMLYWTKTDRGGRVLCTKKKKKKSLCCFKKGLGGFGSQSFGGGERALWLVHRKSRPGTRPGSKSWEAFHYFFQGRGSGLWGGEEKGPWPKKVIKTQKRTGVFPVVALNSRVSSYRNRGLGGGQTKLQKGSGENKWSVQLGVTRNVRMNYKGWESDREGGQLGAWTKGDVINALDTKMRSPCSTRRGVISFTQWGVLWRSREGKKKGEGRALGEGGGQVLHPVIMLNWFGSDGGKLLQEAFVVFFKKRENT